MAIRKSSLRFLILIVVIIIQLFSTTEPRPLYGPYVERSDNPNQYEYAGGAVLVKGGKGHFRITWENQEIDPSQYQPARVSPGGPDPKHHL